MGVRIANSGGRKSRPKVSKVRESSIEYRFVKRLVSLKFIVLKVGHTGWPDRLIMRNGRHLWIELKRPGGKLRPSQLKRMQKLAASGEACMIVDDVEEGVRLAIFHCSI